MSKIVKTILILLGAPYCGKGTQSKLIAKKYGFCHISTGDVLREKAKEDNDLGRQIKDLIDSGQYVPDKMITDILKEVLLKNFASKGFVLDGYPRTMKQKTMLKRVFKSLSMDVNMHAIILDVNEEELKNRHLLRLKIEDRVDDRDDKVLQERQKQFKKTIPVIQSFKDDQAATTISVQDDMKPDGVFTLIQQVLAGKMHGETRFCKGSRVYLYCFSQIQKHIIRTMSIIYHQKWGYIGVRLCFLRCSEYTR